MSCLVDHVQCDYESFFAESHARKILQSCAKIKLRVCRGGGGGLLFLRHIYEKGNNTCIVCIEVDIRKKLKA
jgi:hypothetical protein